MADTPISTRNPFLRSKGKFVDYGSAYVTIDGVTKTIKDWLTSGSNVLSLLADTKNPVITSRGKLLDYSSAYVTIDGVSKTIADWLSNSSTTSQTPVSSLNPYIIRHGKYLDFQNAQVFSSGDFRNLSVALGSGGGVLPPSLGPLSLSLTSATVGSSFTAEIIGKTAGSAVALSGAGAAGLSVSGSSVSGTPTTAGAVNLVETLAGATNSPRTSSGVLTVAAAAATPLTILVLGSSTPERYFTAFSGPDNPRVSASANGTTFSPVGTTGQGAATLGDGLVTRLNRDIRFVKRGIGGTTLTQWEADGSTQRSGAVTAALAAGNIDAIWCAIGYNDAQNDKSVVSVDAHAAKLRSFYGKLRSELGRPNVPIFVATTQKYRQSDVDVQAQNAMVRYAELAVAGDANNYLYGHAYDLPVLSDLIHLPDGGYTSHALRGAAQMGAVLGGTQQQQRGPRIASATAVSDTQTDVALQYVAGSDFTPTSGLTGFELSLDGFASFVSITSAVRQSANMVRLTHASTGSAVVQAAVRYMAGANPVTTGTLYANTAVPVPPDYTPTPLTFQTIAAVAPPATARKAQINVVGLSASDGDVGATFPAPSGWQNFYAFRSTGSLTPLQLVDGNGAALGWTAAVTTAFGGVNIVGVQAAGTGIYPDNVIRTAVFCNSGAVGAIAISGLTPGKSYRFSALPSRDGTGTRNTTFTLNGDTANARVVNAMGNKANLGVIEAVCPANGIMEIVVSGSSNFSYLNGLVVEELA